jgi:hypothetical protein
MCMSCGCGDATVRHHEGDITYDDLVKAASAAGIDPETAADNIHNAANQARDGGSTQ